MKLRSVFFALLTAIVLISPAFADIIVEPQRTEVSGTPLWLILAALVIIVAVVLIVVQRRKK